MIMAKMMGWPYGQLLTSPYANTLNSISQHSKFKNHQLQNLLSFTFTAPYLPCRTSHFSLTFSEARPPEYIWGGGKQTTKPTESFGVFIFLCMTEKLGSIMLMHLVTSKHILEIFFLKKIFTDGVSNTIAACYVLACPTIIEKSSPVR